MHNSLRLSIISIGVALTAMPAAAAFANVPNRCSACPARVPPAPPIVLSAKPTWCPGYVTITARINVTPNTQYGYVFALSQDWHYGQLQYPFNLPLVTTDASGFAQVSKQFWVVGSQVTLDGWFAIYKPVFTYSSLPENQAPFTVKPRCVNEAAHPLQAPTPIPIVTPHPR